MRTYGKLVKRLQWNNSGSDCGIMDRTILVYETETLFKVEVWNSGFKGWHGTNHRPLKETTYKKNHGYNSPDDLCVVIKAKKDFITYNVD